MVWKFLSFVELLWSYEFEKFVRIFNRINFKKKKKNKFKISWGRIFLSYYKEKILILFENN